MEIKSVSAHFDVHYASRVEETMRELTRRRADLMPHSGRSLELHLRGTYDVLTGWDQPPRVCLAGLLHNAYSTEAFGSRLFSMERRSRVRDLIGREAEHLVWLFCSIHRQQLFDALQRTEGAMRESLRLANRWGGPALLITKRDAGDLLVLFMANVAEQSCLPAGAPTHWLAYAATMGGWAANLAEVTPPVFDGCTAAVSKGGENSLLEGYGAALKNACVNPEAGTAQFASAVSEAAWVAEPLVWLAFLSIALGDGEAAGELGADSERQIAAWIVPWDKRLTAQSWMNLAKLAQREAVRRDEEFDFARENVRTVLRQAAGSPERLYMGMETRGLFPADAGSARPALQRVMAPRAGRLPARFEEFIDGFRFNEDEPRRTFYPGLSSTPWHDASSISLARALERSAEEIRAEVRQLDSRLFQDEAEDIRREGRWSVLFLNERDRRHEETRRLCPATSSILDSHPEVTNFAGAAYFSSLDPMTTVAAHRGPTNMRLRCHLGLEVPEGCGLKVGGIQGTWKSGGCILFDDSFLHEVWNHSSQRRVVLIVDVWHPDLTEEEVSLLIGFQRYILSHRANLARYWERNEKARAVASARLV